MASPTNARVGNGGLRVLFLSMEYPPETGWGGIGAYVAVVARALAARGHEVHVLSCVRGQPKSDYQDRGVWVHRRGQMHWKGLGRMLFSPATGLRLDVATSCFLEWRRLGIRFDVVDAPSWMGEGFMFAVLRSAPLVVYLVSSPLLIDATTQERPPWGVRLADRFERVAIERAHLVTTPSTLVLESLRASASLRNREARVVRYAVDLDRWSLSASPASTKPVVLFVGRLEPRKAPETLVEAVALLAKEVGDVEAVFIGRSNGQRNGIAYGDWVAECARQLNAPCRFLGQVAAEDLVDWYKLARVVAVPSRYESFSLVAAEAMAAGRPVVCTTKTGIAELLYGSDAGKAVSPDDPVELADALRIYLADATWAEQAGKAGRRLVEQYCAPEIVAKEREACYGEAISRWK